MIEPGQIYVEVRASELRLVPLIVEYMAFAELLTEQFGNSFHASAMLAGKRERDTESAATGGHFVYRPSLSAYTK